MVGWRKIIQHTWHIRTIHFNGSAPPPAHLRPKIATTSCTPPAPLDRHPRNLHAPIPRRCVSRSAPTRITAHGKTPCHDLRIFNTVTGSKRTLIRGTRTPALSCTHRRNGPRRSSSSFLLLLLLLLPLLLLFRPPLPRRRRSESESSSRPREERGGRPTPSPSYSPDASRSISPTPRRPPLLSLERPRRKRRRRPSSPNGRMSSSSSSFSSSSSSFSSSLSAAAYSRR